MQASNWSRIALLVGAVLPLAACAGGSDPSEAVEPATIEAVAGSKYSQITLTQEAATRLDLQTARVVSAAGAKAIPYASVLYSTTGEAYAYVSPRPLTFVRELIVVARIDGDRAILSSGPPVGTTVATVGVVELYGAESGLGGH